MKEKSIGILGGMGPEATWDFYGRIIKATPACQDSEHIRVIIDSNPKIPDRTRAILGLGPSPVEAMIESGRYLEQSGADFLVIPCMTAHHFIKPVQEALNIKIINGFELIRSFMDSDIMADKKTAVIATTGCINTRIFEKYLDEDRLLFLDDMTQNTEVMDIIYGPRGIKAGHVSGEVIARLTRLFEVFQQQGAEYVIAGCTEISLVLKNQSMPLPVIDPMDLLALEAVKLVKGLSL